MSNMRDDLSDIQIQRNKVHKALKTLQDNLKRKGNNPPGFFFDNMADCPGDIIYKPLSLSTKGSQDLGLYF